MWTKSRMLVNSNSNNNNNNNTCNNAFYKASYIQLCLSEAFNTGGVIIPRAIKTMRNTK